MSILILGLGKTGTTGLYNSVKGAIRARGEDWCFLFEPTAAEPFRSLRRYAPGVPLLAKVMINRERACEVDYDAFEHRMMVVRDPRDVAVSRLLFRPLIRSAVVNVSPEDLRRFLDAVREKEKEPGAWSVRGLHSLADDLGISSSAWPGYARHMDRQIQLGERYGFFRMRYEDFVDGRLDALGDYLGFPVESTEARSGSWLSHITRSKGYGDWRHWFTDDDIEFFRPIFEPYMRKYGYADDWTTADEPIIDPESASGYIERKLAERKPQVDTRYTKEWTVASVTEESQVTTLADMADDGDPVATERLARLLLDGGIVPADPPAAARWARRGAILGHTPAMRLLADCYAQGLGVDTDEDQQRFWAREADDLDRQAREQREAKTREQREAKTREQREQREQRHRRKTERSLRAARLETERLRARLTTLERSTPYQLGSALVDAAARPGRNTLTLPRRLWRLYRQKRPRRRHRRGDTTSAPRSIAAQAIRRRRSPGERLARRLPRLAKDRVADLALRHRVAYRLKLWYVGRRCDVYLISFPKSGRTWLRLMIARALQPRYGLPDRQLMRVTNAAVTLPGVPRILATHDDSPQVKSPEELLTDKVGYRRHKVIFLARDPRDVVVSLYFHKTRQRGEQLEGSLSEFVRQPAGGIDSIVAFYNLWAEQRDVPRGFLLVRYEDLHDDPARELGRVLDFLGVEVSDRDLRRAVRSTSFERMHRAEQRDSLQTQSLRPGDADDPESYRVRRGEVGGFRDYLGQGDVEHLGRHVRERLSPFFGYDAP